MCQSWHVCAARKLRQRDIKDRMIGNLDGEHQSFSGVQVASKPLIAKHADHLKQAAIPLSCIILYLSLFIIKL
jgi:hypothetical protein